MGLVSKLKNILFEEEEVEIPVIEKKKEVKPVEKTEYKELPKKEEVKAPLYDDFYNNLEPVVKKETKMEERAKKEDVVSERELFRSEQTFNFPAFDEEEFDNIVPKPKQRAVNVLEHERKKVEKNNNDFQKRLEKKEESTKTKFRPSPIISPVYGILDKNYTPEEITTRNDSSNLRTLDVDSVRKKAFGVLDEEKKEAREKKLMDDKILEEKLEKARTIDELLKDSSDEVIPVKEDIEELNEYKEPVKKEVTSKELEDDTLENDLFDLIDSMYENREDGE